MDPVHILIDPVHGPGPRRGSMDQGSMFCTFPYDVSVLVNADLDTVSNVCLNRKKVLGVKLFKYYIDVYVDAMIR